MLKFGWILVYFKYWTLNLVPLMVYPKVLVGVDIHLYIQCLASGLVRPPACLMLHHVLISSFLAIVYVLSVSVVEVYLINLS